MFPVMLCLRGAHCLVVGGGQVALRKVEGLLAEGARVTVVAREPLVTLAELSDRGALSLHRRSYRPGEAGDFAIVFAATDRREVNRQVARDAGATGKWVNVADDPELCTFHLPGRIQRGPLQLAIASDGEAPFLVRRLRQLLERVLDPEWGGWARAAARLRVAVLERRPKRTVQEACYDRFFSATVDAERLRVRVPTEGELAGWLAETARPSPTEEETEEPSLGLVSLVGAGPGNASLLTIRGYRRLLAADAVVYDRLAAGALPCDLSPAVELHAVGKEAGCHPVPQEQINALLVTLARQGKRVVRLKGGDPYVFGRGGEEASVLQSAGIPFEVVPGVTAGVAVPAAAGIPVTQRGEVVKVCFFTAHESAKSKGPQLDWNLLAADPHTTLVGYMGVGSLSRVVNRLLAGGMDPNMPAALVERGTTAAQRTVRSTLESLAEHAEKAGVEPPALLVIGRTVRYAESLDALAAAPLRGERLVVGRPAGRLADVLEIAGAEVLETPVPLTPAAQEAIATLPVTGWIVRTVGQAEAFAAHLAGKEGMAGSVAWSVGQDAARRAREVGWERVEELDESWAESEVIAAIAARRRD